MTGTVDPHHAVHATLERCGVIPVVAVDTPDEAMAIAGALLDGGIGCMEITFRTDAAASAIGAVRARHPDLLVGAGTVLDPAQVDAAVVSGARFVVSPAFDGPVVERCLDLEVPVIPGVMTPTEIQRARRRGLRVLKYFPARTAGGVDAIRSLAAVFPDVRFVPTGGIGPGDLEAYLTIPAVLACGGSWLVERSAATDPDEVRRRAAEAAAVVRRARG